MANVYKILGQVSPSATTETDLYTVPVATSCVSSSIIVCNRDTLPTTFRISITKYTGVSTPTSNKDYIYYDVALAGNDTFIATVGISLGAQDVVRVYSGSTLLSFSIFGTEIS